MHVSGSMSVRRATRSSRPWRGIAACTARMAPSSAHQSNKARHVVLGAAPNNSFKPNLLRSTKAMAGKACHGFGSTTQVGLTQALGAMRIALLALCVSLAGCAPFAVRPAPDQPMAHLIVGDRPGERFSDDYNGIWHVDDRDIPSGPVRSIYVAPGERSIGYICPGWLVLDGPPTLSHIFVAGVEYVLDCTEEPRIRMVQDGT